jgi:hypothetical protein
VRGKDSRINHGKHGKNTEGAKPERRRIDVLIARRAIVISVRGRDRPSFRALSVFSVVNSLFRAQAALI